MDARDWFVLVIHSVAWVVATAFLLWHPNDTNFITWATFSGTVSSAYHWLIIKDDKLPDEHP